MVTTGRLEQTTIGDLLARLYRQSASGTLVIEAQGRRHQVHLRRGYLRSICLEGHFRPLGEQLLARGLITRQELQRSIEALTRGSEMQGEALVRLGALSAQELRSALEEQARERLALLSRCSFGRYRFEPGERWSPGILLRTLPLIRGTPRRRGSGPARAKRSCSGSSAGAGGSPEPVAPGPGRHFFLGIGRTRRSRLGPEQLLGISPGASHDEVKRAYRRLALELHPDRHPEVDELTRRSLAARLAEVNAAYDKLRK